MTDAVGTGATREQFIKTFGMQRALMEKASRDDEI